MTQLVEYWEGNIWFSSHYAYRLLLYATTSEKQMSHQLKKQYLDIRYIESTETPTASAAKVTLLVADRRSSLVIELQDDLKNTFTAAVGRSNYSNNKIVVLSYIAIFENLWNQSELYQQIRQAYEQLKIHDTMHEEFINMAAHELRNPIQPILGLTEALRTIKRGVPDSRQEDMLDAIIRNAKRLAATDRRYLGHSKDRKPSAAN